ncbi:protein TusB [bacterium BMS3Abin07]|nr:protein TusB [bacterium BMS3Abin07]GBE32672.1 protein TusB [bacterium BMS3Bbin05]HDZ87443.1 sulfurtransferase complex subunit TusB [Nitrospirota bacterium]
MKLGIFVNQYKCTSEALDRMKADRLGIILVQNGIYYATVKENGKAAALLDKDAEFYALSEDIQSRGFTESDVDGKVKVIDYNGLVDLIFNDYEKFAWI